MRESAPIADARRQRRDGRRRIVSGAAVQGRRVCCDPLYDLRPLRRRNWRQRVQDVGRRDGTTERKHGAPSDPVTPYGERRDELDVAHPGRRAVDRGAARFVGKEACDFRVGKRLNEAQRDRCSPDEKGEITCRAGNTADGEQHERRHAARNPERTDPGNRSMQFALFGNGVQFVCKAGHRALPWPQTAPARLAQRRFVQSLALRH